MKKGFTLIELLAVIVVLALIALIAIPTMSKIIDKTKKGSIESSALGYIDAVEKQKAVNDLNSENSDNIEEGVYTAPLSQYKVRVKGQEPKKGWVEVTKKGIDRYSLLIGDYTITYDGENKTIEKGDKVTDRPTNYPEVVYTQAKKSLRVGDPVDGNIDLGERAYIKYGSDEVFFDSMEICNGIVKAMGIPSTCSTKKHITPELSYLTTPNSSWDVYLKLHLNSKGIITAADACNKTACIPATLAAQNYDSIKASLTSLYPGYTLYEAPGYIGIGKDGIWAQVTINQSVGTASLNSEMSCGSFIFNTAGCMAKEQSNFVSNTN